MSTVNLSSVDARVQELAQKAIKRSGNQFFGTVQRKTAAFIDAVTKESVDEEALEDVVDVLTPESLVLLCRWHAGEITKGKRKRGGPATLHDKVTALIKKEVARKVLDVIFLSALVDAAQTECESREAEAKEKEDFWANDYAEPVDWHARAEAIDVVKTGWEEASEAAKSGDWQSLVSAGQRLGSMW